MAGRRLVAALATVVALSLLAAPVTMADWDEQAEFHVEEVSRSDLHAYTPVTAYEDLSPSARTAFRRALRAPDGRVTVYGEEDHPDEFYYSDNARPGRGVYGVVYQGQYYRLTTFGGGGLILIHIIYKLPVMFYGFFLAAVAYGSLQGEIDPALPALGAVAGVGLHLLGPAFDFPMLGSGLYMALCIATPVLLGTVLSVFRSPAEDSAET